MMGVDLLELGWWVFIAFCCAVVIDFIRLAILRAIWNRRHARMSAEVKRRFSDGTCMVSTAPTRDGTKP